MVIVLSSLMAFTFLGFIANPQKLKTLPASEVLGDILGLLLFGSICDKGLYKVSAHTEMFERKPLLTLAA